MNFCSTTISRTFKSATNSSTFENATNFFCIFSKIRTNQGELYSLWNLTKTALDQIPH